jgi:hypothetical protein
MNKESTENGNEPFSLSILLTVKQLDALSLSLSLMNDRAAQQRWSK